MKLSEHGFTIRQQAPKVGEHTTQILAAAGYTPMEIAITQKQWALG